jgi:uncharacterized OB-fold protein
MSATCLGTVQSHTVIRVPDKAHAAMAPFTLLLVALTDGKRVLGHFHGVDVPAIGSRVTGSAAENETIVFRALQETP